MPNVQTIEITTSVQDNQDAWSIIVVTQFELSGKKIGGFLDTRTPPGRAERFHLGGSRDGVRMRDIEKSIGYEGRHQTFLIPTYSPVIVTC